MAALRGARFLAYLIDMSRSLRSGRLALGPLATKFFTSSERMEACALCAALGGELLWQDADCRVILVSGDEGAAFPGFCRVVWQAHVAELSDLNEAQQHHLIEVVSAVERALRLLVEPDKINLASLGNVVPHLHWHVIPRWRDDSHFPAPIWAPPQRAGRRRAPPEVARLRRLLVEQLGAGT